MYDAIRYGTAVYRNELAKRVQQIGYRIQPAKHGFQIEGVSDEVLKRFSKRAQQRDAVVRKWNKSWGANFPTMPFPMRCIRAGRKKSKASRRRKCANANWRNCQPDEQAITAKTLGVGSTRPAAVPLVENQALNHAVAHVFERKSVVPEHELLNVALSQRLGEVDLPALKAAVKYSPDLVKTERGFSTRQILATELDLIQTVNAGCDAVAPLHPGYRPADWLGEDQRRAIYHVLRTSDRITGLRGLAGSGKTTALRELVAACKEARLNRCSARRRRRQRMFCAKKDSRR
jgi:hypothetical protein